MARILPDGWRELDVTGAARREIETLQRLADGLDEHYTVYHGVHWTRLEQQHSVFGEIDFVVANGAGDLLLIEQKSGLLEETPEGLVKRYPGKSKSVVAQLARSVDALRAKLKARPDCAEVHLDYLLYCPDYRVREPLTAGLSPERIVDHRRDEELARIVASLLPPVEDSARAAPIHRFLRDQIRLEADVSALVGQAQALVTRVSGGLTHWARQLEFSPFRLRVIATAGSGKTQLALAELQDAVARGERPLYLCFNRPLADHMARIAPPGALACTFHALCERVLRSAGQEPDFRRPDAFTGLVEAAAALTPGAELLFDTLIIDEGQDFTPRWAELALRHARPQARLLWLEDPLQKLHEQPAVELPGWITLRSRRNYRSPRPVLRWLQGLLPPDQAPEAASPLDAAEIDFITYRDQAGLLQGIKDAVRSCYGAGFRHQDVVLLSFRGRENSVLTPFDRIGPHRLRRFSGRYDLFGAPIYEDGDLLLESVHRFKGQAAPAIILAEVDFDPLDGRALRKLFVGATRANLKLVVVLSERAAAALLAAGGGTS